MSSLLVEMPGVLGDQRPRIHCAPPRVSSAGLEVAELAAMAGLVLDPWEEFVLVEALGERADGRWAAFEIGLVVPRQNGKGAILEARELGGLFLLGERLVVHTAHELATSLEAFRRLLELVEGTPEFSRRVRSVQRSHGEEGIELYGEGARRFSGGQRIRFRTRTKGGGRGWSGDCVLLDEAMALPEPMLGALMPTVSARPNPQIWYTGSAVDQLEHDDGVVLSRIRARGVAGGDPSLCYSEWSVDRDTPDELEVEVATDPEAWARANPAIGIRITTEHVANEQRSMDPRTFAVERLCVGDWARVDGAKSKIPLAQYDAMLDQMSVAVGPVWFSIDVTPDRSRSSISAAGMREDGLHHVEVVDRRAGTAWVADRAAELLASHAPLGFLCDDRGPVASLFPEIEEAGVTVETLDSQAHARACGYLLDQITRAGVRHRGQPELRSAVRGAATRPLGDAWAWSRKNSGVDISPLVSVTLALWGFGRDMGADDAGFEAW